MTIDFQAYFQLYHYNELYIVQQVDNKLVTMIHELQFHLDEQHECHAAMDLNVG